MYVCLSVFQLLRVVSAKHVACDTDRQTHTRTHPHTCVATFLSFFLPNEVGSAKALLFF